MPLLKNVLIKASGNRFVQTLLERNVHVSQFLMGIGSGGAVSASGEQAVFQALKNSFKPPYCIFDVGSNKGQFLQLIFANIETNYFSVHCFEPGHEAFIFLEESLKGDKRVKLNEIGVSKEKGETVLYFDRAGSALASLTKRRLDHFGINFDKSEKIQTSTIDSYCAENAIAHIHLLKIDVEGHELDVLAGARKMLDGRSIDIITFEFGGCNIDTRTFFQDYWYFFDQSNMDIFRITPSGYFCPIESYKEIHEQFRTANFIAALRSSTHLRL